MSVGITPARRAAFEVLRRTFEGGAFTDRAFASAAARFELSGRELAQGRRLAYGAVQRAGTADHVVGSLARRPVERLDAPVIAALRQGLFELLFSAPGGEHAAVDQTVELAKAGMRRDGAPPGRAAAAATLVNAILRRAARELEAIRAAFDDSTPEGAAIAHSYPEWLARMWWEELGPDEARKLMHAMNEPAETALRVNTLQAAPDRIAAALRDDGIAVSAADPPAFAEGLVVDRAAAPVEARIATGELVPQSRGSQAVVALLDPRPGERILDLCAGPGIKTTAIAAMMEDRGELVAVESDARRASEIRELCARTGVTCARVEVADAAEADLGAGYDRVLVDPPCSDLGTLASRPDARWRKSPDQIERLAAIQRRIAIRGARTLRPGGTLVYSTCTISRRENEEVAASVAERIPGLGIDDLGAMHPRLASRSDHRFLQIRPDRDRTTGFFIARFSREPAAGGEAPR